MASYLFCCFLLQLLFGAVLTGQEMLVFSEMSFPLFPNLTLHEHITVFKNGNEKSEIIARWEMKNAIITSEWKRSDYMQKIFIDVLDKTLIIWICNVGQTHSAKYKVIYDIDTTGPEVELTVVENKQLDVCLNSPPNSPEKCFGKLTEDEFEKWLDDHPGFMKKYCGNLTAEQIGEEVRKWLADHPEYIKGSLGNLTGEQIQQDVRKWLADHQEYIKEYLEKVVPEQILQMLPCNHPKEVLKESSDSWNPLILGLQIVTCIIGIIILFLFIRANKLSKEDQVHKWLNDHPDFMDKYLGKLTEDQIFKQIQKWDDAYNGLLKNKYLELSKEDQVHKWLNDHPDFMDKYLGKLTGDQICKQIQKWQDAYRGLFDNKYLDAHENDHQVVPPTLDELSVTLTQYSGTGIDGNPNQSVSTQEIFNASQHSGEDVNNYQAVVPTPVEPPVTLTETGNEIKDNEMQMSARKTFIESRSSDELVNHDTATKPTLIDLAVTWCGPVTGTEDNQGQLELSSTCNGPSSATFSEPGHSGKQPFNNNEQDANPEQDTAQDVRVVIEDSDSEDKCKVPLLEGSC